MVLVSLRRKIRDVLIDLFKLKQTLLLILSGLLSYLIASNKDFDATIAIKLVASMFFTIAGTTGLNMILDKDIDIVMIRTINRPIPRGRLSIHESLAYSILAIIIGLWIAYRINIYVLIAGLLGLIVDIFLYTYILKRKSWISVVIGGFAGGAPAFGGYMAYETSSLLDAIIIMSIVSLWAMIHIWFISIYYKDDYVRAHIPMLPIIKGEKNTAKISLVWVLVIMVLSTLLYHRGVIGVIAIFIIGTQSMYLMFKIFEFHKDTNNELLARRIYKFLNIYLGLSLLVGSLEKLII